MANSTTEDRSPLLNYGSETENRSALPTLRSRRERAFSTRLLSKPTYFYAINAIAVIGMVGVMMSMHNTILRLESQLKQKEAAPVQVMSNSHRHMETEYDRLPVSALPSKFGVQYVTPRQDQAHRGTCWDFATIGLLEQSYRENGVRNGWLEPEEYVAFSEQAYGVEIMKLCTGPEDSQQQVNCRVAGDSMWQNSTEGGEIPELYYLREGLKESVFPQSVCKYYVNEGNDTLCPGMEKARPTNPLKFNVKNMETRYDDLSVKELLFKRNKAMGLSTPVAMVTHYYPCIGSFANDRHCQPDSCTLCPPELSMTTCCVPLKGGNNRNMEGEFFSHRGMSIEGGHAMLLVGYNDAFLTRDGFTGGLIVKNSWADGPRQGSHTLKYWLQEVSDWEERVVCPNSYNPHNWYQCGNEGISASNGFNRSNAFNEGIQACLSEEAKIYAKVNVQPIHLKCKDPKQCHIEEDFTYFVRNTTDWGDRMTVMCLWEYSEKQHISREICLKPMLEIDIAKTLQPVAEEVQENDTDRCGFYFIPYEALRHWISQFQGFFVNNFEIEWDPQSYAANKEEYPELDYTLLEKSTKKQHQDDFIGPFPNAKVIKKFPQQK